MAIDEAITKARGEDKVPDTLRFYMWKPSAVTLGYFQSVEDEVNLEALQRFGFYLNRRISGGGAVSGTIINFTTQVTIGDRASLEVSISARALAI